MKFHLRSLLAVVTVAGILVAVVVSIVNHRKRVHEHRLTFFAIDDRVSSLDSELRAYVLSIDSVAKQLQAADPVSPEIALGHGISGESMSFGTCFFYRTYHFDWQLPDGSRCAGVQLTVEAELDEDSFEDHRVRLTYEANPLNESVASWVNEQLAAEEHVEIEHVKLQKPLAPESKQATNGMNWESNGMSVYGGIR